MIWAKQMLKAPLLYGALVDRVLLSAHCPRQPLLDTRDDIFDKERQYLETILTKQ